MKSSINVVKCPAVTDGVLGHFQSGYRNTTGVGSFCRAIEYVVCKINIDGFRSGRHVCAFNHSIAAVLYESLGGLAVDFVLGCARKSDVTGNIPNALAALMVLSFWMSDDILFDSLSLNFLELFNESKINTVLIVNITIGVRDSDNFRTELGCFLNSIDGNVTGTGDDNSLTIEAFAVCFEHLIGIVADTITGSLSTGKRTTIVQAFTGKNAVPVTGQSLVLAEQITDLTAANTDITGRNVLVRSDVTIELTHEALAEPLNLSVGFALRVEVGAAFTAAHGEGGQRVLKDLLETEELDNADIYGRMETKTAFVRADRGVELYTETTVNLYVSVVIVPRNAEDDLSLRLNDSLEYTGLYEVRAGIGYRIKGREYFGYSLYELGLISVSSLNGFQDVIKMLILHNTVFSNLMVKMMDKMKKGNGVYYTIWCNDPIAVNV